MRSDPQCRYDHVADGQCTTVGLFCPFAHRIIVTREFKGLQEFLPLSTVKAYPKEDGDWRIPATDEEYSGSTVDYLFHSNFLHEVYFKSNTLKKKIDEINSWMMPGLNTGVYKVGFASTQEDYEKNSRIVFETLDRLEKMLTDHQRLYLLVNPNPTEVDIKLYANLVRFDIIYQQYFKLMSRNIRHGYPLLNRWLKNFYWNVEGVKNTTNFEHVKENYSKIHLDINSKSITPLGPEPEVKPWTEEDDSRWMEEIAGIK